MNIGIDTIIFYTAAITLTIASLVKNRQKTKKAFIKAWKAFENILPQFISIMVIIGVAMTLLDPETISHIIGSESGWLGVALAAVIGAITLMPGFVAFPTAALLLAGGAGYMQIGAFVSSLMMVGVVTLPMEFKVFGKKVALLRNAFALVFAFAVAFVIGKVMGEI
jgi:uncharacterized membrane protein YraQ (UPF0718 family)